jgi:membrane protein YqaA with SNARE-associated domain
LTALKELLARYAAWIWSLLEPLGAWGVFGIAAVDAAFMGLPLDPVVAGYVYAKPHLFWAYVLMASAGSALGSSVLYIIGHKGGELLLHKSGPRHVIEAFRARFARRQFLALMIPAILPPPTPLKLFVLAAAVFGMSYRMFLLALFTGRVIRFSILSLLTILFGPQIVRMTRTVLSEHLPWVLGGLAFAAAAWTLSRYLKKREPVPQEDEASGS